MPPIKLRIVRRQKQFYLNYHYNGELHHVIPLRRLHGPLYITAKEIADLAADLNASIFLQIYMSIFSPQSPFQCRIFLYVSLSLGKLEHAIVEEVADSICVTNLHINYRQVDNRYQLTGEHWRA